MTGAAPDDGQDLADAIRTSARRRPDPDAEPVELRLPFEGLWRTERTPAHRVPSHGTHALGLTFAFDFVPVDDRGRSASVRDWRTALSVEPVDRFVGLGRAVLAPAAGRVIAVHDGEPDHEARRSMPSRLRYALTQAARVRAGAVAVTGNHVVLTLDGRKAFVLLAHLRQGSVAVSVGERVTAGQLVGTCGNSGNSTQPHLHVQAMDDARPTAARGLPVVFLDYLSRGPRSARSVPVDAGVPERYETVEPAGSGPGSAAAECP